MGFAYLIYTQNSSSFLGTVAIVVGTLLVASIVYGYFWQHQLASLVVNTQNQLLHFGYTNGLNSSHNKDVRFNHVSSIDIAERQGYNDSDVNRYNVSIMASGEKIQLTELTHRGQAQLLKKQLAQLLEKHQ